MLIVVLAAPVKHQPLAVPGQNIALQLRALARQQVGNIHAERLGDIEQMGKGKIFFAFFIFNIVFQGNLGAVGDVFLGEAQNIPEVSDPQRDHLNLSHEKPSRSVPKWLAKVLRYAIIRE